LVAVLLIKRFILSPSDMFTKYNANARQVCTSKDDYINNKSLVSLYHKLLRLQQRFLSRRTYSGLPVAFFPLRMQLSSVLDWTCYPTKIISRSYDAMRYLMKTNIYSIAAE